MFNWWRRKSTAAQPQPASFVTEATDNAGDRGASRAAVDAGVRAPGHSPTAVEMPTAAGAPIIDPGMPGAAAAVPRSSAPRQERRAARPHFAYAVGATAIERVGRRQRQGRIVKVQASGRRVIVALGSTGRRYVYALGADGTYRLSGTPKGVAPCLELPSEDGASAW